MLRLDGFLGPLCCALLRVLEALYWLLLNQLIFASQHDPLAPLSRETSTPRRTLRHAGRQAVARGAACGFRVAL